MDQPVRRQPNDLRPARQHLDVLDSLDETLARLDRDQVIDRLWQKDHTLWRDDPTEITNRLGWLDLVTEPPTKDAELEDFLAGVRADGLSDAVLLGMGGSSLGAEALRASYGDLPGALRLHVLDSTHPRWVERVRRAIDPAKTIFLVASKSGTTAEVMAFFHYFWHETHEILGETAGRQFAVITDPGSPLLELAETRKFRHAFVNPPDIGGRFSVLSRFGLVAAALAGIDVGELMTRAHDCGRASSPGHPAAENPGAWLGAVLGAAALAGRDQLTLMTSPRIATFGLWAEQLIAESTGKEGKGILPVTGEPWVGAERYGDQRVFVALRYGPEPGAELDGRIDALVALGQPVVVYELEDLAALGAELFRWQMATAVAGHLLGIHPFDQPDVQSAKTETNRVLAQWQSEGRLPRVKASADLLAELGKPPRPTYVALMAYADQSPTFDAAIEALRSHLLDDFGLTSTFGYGPRFLHSTGQLHKGGAPGGLFVQLIAERDAELEIPGQSHGFGVLVQAQAAGDLAALQNAGRRCVRLDLGDEPVAAVEGLVDRAKALSPDADLPFF